MRARADWLLRLAWVMVAGGAITVAVLLVLAGGSAVQTDRYEVLHVVSDPAQRRHAVVYRHHHADTSAVMDGIWIVAGVAPPIGSRLKPEGRPIALWRDFRPAVLWKDGRVVIAGDVAPARVTAAPDSGADCTFEDGSGGTRRLQLCFDSARVTFVRSRL